MTIEVYIVISKIFPSLKQSLALFTHKHLATLLLTKSRVKINFHTFDNFINGPCFWQREKYFETFNDF